MSTVYHRPADPSGDDSYVRPLFADRCQAGFPSPAVFPSGFCCQFTSK
ncbi:hypothetical protein HID46_004372 [Escherichia coli]|nr:hypothetical protein [Escherichia coli]